MQQVSSDSAPFTVRGSFKRGGWNRGRRQGPQPGEDTQPNESISARRQSAPPSILSSSMVRGGRGGRGRPRGFSHGPPRPYPRPHYVSSNQASSTSSIFAPVHNKRQGHDLQPDAKRQKRNQSPQPKMEEDEMDLAPLPPAYRGTKLYAPLPENCVKGRPSYLAHRESWITLEKNRLSRKGIRMVNMCVVRYVKCYLFYAKLFNASAVMMVWP